jgi:hypothetical protein
MFRKLCIIVEKHKKECYQHKQGGDSFEAYLLARRKE